MDLGYLLSILLRRKWLIIAAGLAAAAAAFFFIGSKPDRYKASVILSTGIVNYKGINSDNSDAFVQQYQVENAFSNLVEIAQSRSCIKLLTIQMLRHDLQAGGAQNEQPFRQANKKWSDFSDADRDKLLAQMLPVNLDSLDDPAFDPEFDYLLDKIARAYGYDHDAIRRNLSVKRKGETDYLTVEMITENPELSKYLANAYVNRFVTYYQNLSMREKRKTVESLNKLAEEKKYVVDSIKNNLYLYLYQNKLPALGEQSKELINQIKELELQKQRAYSKRQSSEESVGIIRSYIDDRATLDAGETKERVIEKYNSDGLREKVLQLTEKSIKSGKKDPKVEAELSVAKQELEQSIRSSAQSLGKPRRDESKRTKEDLYKDMVAAEVDKVEAEKSIGQLNSEIGYLNRQLSAFVVNDQVATGMQSDQARAEKEFDEVNAKLIDAKLALEKEESLLRIIENAQTPEWPEPDRQVLTSAFAGFAVAALVVIALLMLAFFDTSLQNAEIFKKASGNLPLLGAVNIVSLRGLDFQSIFSTARSAPAYTDFRENLRKIRKQILESGGKVVLFTSPLSKEGKTFLMSALGHSLAANSKKVLLIDTNFKSGLLSRLADAPTPNAEVINQAIAAAGLSRVFDTKDQGRPEAGATPVDVIANNGGQGSPSEMLDTERFRQFLSDLQQHYDYIFLEAAALNQYSDTRELEPFADSVVAVFNARSTIGAATQESIEYLRGLNGKFLGAILTGVREKKS